MPQRSEFPIMLSDLEPASKMSQTSFTDCICFFSLELVGGVVGAKGKESRKEGGGVETERYEGSWVVVIHFGTDYTLSYSCRFGL